jgi:hypothetical protein
MTMITLCHVYLLLFLVVVVVVVVLAAVANGLFHRAVTFKNENDSSVV